MSTWCIQLAAGSGSRFGGDVPKQLVPVAGRPSIAWSIDAAASACDGQVLVVPVALVDEDWPDGLDAVVAGGAERADSVRAGLAAVPDDADVVVGVGRVERGDDPRRHLRGEGVHPVRAVERDRRDPVGHLGAHVHERSTRERPRNSAITRPSVGRVIVTS